MRYRSLGRTGVRVSELTLGTMTFGSGLEDVSGVDQKGAKELVARALEAGVNSFDTADIYSSGESEELLGRALGSRRDEVMVATKAGIRFGEGPGEAGSGRAHLTRQLEGSLRRLETDWVDLFYVHVFDETVDPEELGATLDDFVQSGKARHVAASNFPAWRLMQALALSDNRGWARYAAYQALWNPLARDVEDELVPLCRDQEVALFSWSPLAGGLLSGKYRRGAERPAGARVSDPASEWSGVDQELAFDVVEVLDLIASAHGATVAQVALAWQLARPWLTSIVLGARTPAQLEDNLGAANLELTEEEVGRIDAAAPAPRRWPAWHIAVEAEQRDLAN
ncbi:MAG: aldo/keto reductase [Actinobacteria bacterium]|nr:aldo/keto reductase [Actinomycetota bacterium]